MYTSFERRLKIWQEKLLKEISLRLRHSFASLTNAVGISQFNASKMLGHSTTATTSKIYAHMYDI